MESQEELLARIARHFAHFAEHEAAESSPLYAYLSRGVAADLDILALAALAWPKRPVPNLLFGAVHYLLLKGADHPLRGYYPSVTTPALPPEGAYPVFRAFCLEQRDAIAKLLASRLVQTNEVRRCACLLPAFGIVANEAGGKPLALVEVGASAGLNLLWDRYGYDYGGGRRFGATGSLLKLTCEPRGDLRPPLPDTLPRVASRVGIDLHPVDVRDADAFLWLRALIWPEQRDRAERSEQAAVIARREPPTLLVGDALDMLPGALAGAPAGAALCVFHSFMLNQLSREARQRLYDLFAECAKQRDLYIVSIEYHDLTQPRLDLDIHRNGTHETRILANCQPHGAWIEWLERAGP